MSVSETQSDLGSYCREVAQRARKASQQLSTVPASTKNKWLQASASALADHTDQILAANALDLESATAYGLTDASLDRLRLDEKRIHQISSALREVAAFPDPIGETLEGSIRPNGLDIRKVRVPLGVVFFIYESRPNVTVDAAAICIKSGNAVILRGGKEARHSSTALVDILRRVASNYEIPENTVQLVNTTDRSTVGHFLKMKDCIDVAIPRGGKSLIERVAREAQMPVIKHFDGNCHVFIDESADLKMAKEITVNSKCQRMGVCNAAESLLIHRAVVDQVLPMLAQELSLQGIEIRGDKYVCDVVSDASPATEDDWFAEYLGPVISVKVVDDIEQAIKHINHYGSHHTDAIVTSNVNSAQRFTAGVDSSAVVVNASTRFNDGGEFGLGAEIGISTDKFHARGPCGIKELTTYKYVVLGSGQIRE